MSHFEICNTAPRDSYCITPKAQVYQRNTSINILYVYMCICVYVNMYVCVYMYMSHSQIAFNISLFLHCTVVNDFVPFLCGEWSELGGGRVTGSKSNS